MRGGMRCAVCSSEDFFRYGSRDGKPDFERLCELLDAVCGINEISLVQPDHANVTSVLQLSDGQLKHAAERLRRSGRARYIWVNMGAESASGRLVEANCPGKIRPFRSEDWGQMVECAVEKLARTGFFPVVSIVLGLPGETQEDAESTLNLVRALARRPVAVFPVFYEPPRGSGAFTAADMTAAHLRLFRRCYEINFDVIPKLIWDNQTAAGVPLARRALYQAVGRAQVAFWRRTFGETERRIEEKRS
jgi:radical SAM superfamily enzyme YgiQ (UPF0313 family)